MGMNPGDEGSVYILWWCCEKFEARDKPEGGGVWPFVFLFLCALRIMRALKSQSRIDNRVVGNRGNVVIHGLVTVVCVELPRL